MYAVKILKDSIAPSGIRLTTWELTYPRMVHAELMTHRLFSRNSASSRAIPNEKLRKRVQEDPVLPLWWGKNQTGMQAREELTGLHLERAKEVWLKARDMMLEASEVLGSSEVGLHKQLANRLIEPWMFITVILSSTELDNWFHLRDHPDAQPEIAWVAREMRQQYGHATPTVLAEGEWHLPLIHDEDRVALAGGVGTLRKVSVGRCARVSYLTHDGHRDLEEDVRLHDRLVTSGHWSPFEHVAQALSEPTRHGNFRGWYQYRKEFPTEHAGPRLS